MTRDSEFERYRRATQMTLEQLDWCVEYLRSIRKTRLSKQLAKNRSAISARLPPREEDRRSRDPR